MFKGLKTRLQKAFNESDKKRWNDLNNIFYDWEERTILMSSWIEDNVTVLEFGCARMVLRHHLKAGCKYIPSDLVRRNGETIVFDINRDCWSIIPDVDTVFFSGVMEYVHDVSRVFKECAERSRSLIASYACSTSLNRNVTERRAHGWVNDFTRDEFVEIAAQAGWVVSVEMPWRDQMCFSFRLR